MARPADVPSTHECCFLAKRANNPPILALWRMQSFPLLSRRSHQHFIAENTGIQGLSPYSWSAQLHLRPRDPRRKAASPVSPSAWGPGIARNLASTPRRDYSANSSIPVLTGKLDDCVRPSRAGRSRKRTQFRSFVGWVRRLRQPIGLGRHIVVDGFPLRGEPILRS